MSFTVWIACAVVIATVYALIKRYETRLVLLVSGLVMACVSMQPMMAFKQFDKSMTNGSLIIAICSAIGFAAVISFTKCDVHLVRLLTKPLKKMGLFLLPVCMLITSVIATAIPSMAGLSASVAPTMVPILVRAGFRPSMAAASVGACMMPAYFTALGTQSSAATIPVTLEQTKKNGVNPDVAGFVIPLCATIHMSGSIQKLVACALALMIMQGMPYDFSLFAGFIFLLGITVVAAPGVPGGVIMAALGILQSMLGFGESEQALMIALYIAMDSFGTACNVTGDGAIALIMDKISKQKPVAASV